MQKRDIIGMLKQAWTDALMDEKDLREDLAESYSAWVQGLIEASASDLSGEAKGGQGGGQGGQGLQMAPPEAAQGATPMEGGGGGAPPGMVQGG